MTSGYSVPCTRKRTSANSCGDLFEHPNEGLPDDLALPLRVRDTGEGLHETILGFHMDQVHVERPPEGLLDLISFAHAKQPVIDEDADQLVANRLVNECGSDRPSPHPRRGRTSPVRVPTASRTDSTACSMMPTCVHDRPGPAHLVEEVLDDLLPPHRVANLGVELHAKERAFGMLHRRNRRIRRCGDHPEPGRRCHHSVAMAHPHLLLFRQLMEQLDARELDSVAGPYSPTSLWATTATERLGNDLVAVADAEDGDAEIEDRRGRVRMHRRHTPTPGPRRG